MHDYLGHSFHGDGQGPIGKNVSSTGLAHLQIDIRESKRAIEVPASSCKILKDNGISEEVIMDIHEWLESPGYMTQLIATYRCINGRVLGWHKGAEQKF